MPPRKESAEYEGWLDEIITLTEAAHMRKTSVETVRAMIRQGRLKAIRVAARKLGITRREALRSVRDVPVNND